MSSGGNMSQHQLEIHTYEEKAEEDIIVLPEVQGKLS